jgi:DNA repair photolyase
VKYPEKRRKALHIHKKKQFRCVISTKMCQLKDLALVKEHGIQGFKASQ